MIYIKLIIFFFNILVYILKKFRYTNILLSNQKKKITLNVLNIFNVMIKTFNLINILNGNILEIFIANENIGENINEKDETPKSPQNTYYEYLWGKLVCKLIIAAALIT